MDKVNEVRGRALELRRMARRLRDYPETVSPESRDRLDIFAAELDDKALDHELEAACLVVQSLIAPLPADAERD
jgi:hypothetical protein